VGKTVTKHRNKDREYGEDDYATRNRRGVQDTRVRRKVRYEEILEQVEEESNFVLDEDGLAT
jgi:hypothetical protein